MYFKCTGMGLPKISVTNGFQYELRFPCARWLVHLSDRMEVSSDSGHGLFAQCTSDLWSDPNRFSMCCERSTLGTEKQMKFPTNCGHWFCISCSQKILWGRMDSTLEYENMRGAYADRKCPRREAAIIARVGSED